jgi:hypothetical protein
MNMDQAAIFLAGSILISLGFTCIIVAVVFVNNVLHKYWKPVNIFTPDSWKAFNPPPSQFASQEELERVAPTIDKQIKT